MNETETVTTTDSDEKKPLGRTWAVYIVWSLVLATIALGVVARIETGLLSDPSGVTGDLDLVERVWVDFYDGPVRPYPSIRMGQYVFATILGVMGEWTGAGTAHVAALLALLCSIGLIGTAPFLVYVMGGDRYQMAAAAMVVATSANITLNTLRAESESPFLFFCSLAVALFIIFWNRGNFPALISASILMALATGIRGTGVFHALFLGAGFGILYFVTDKPSRPSLSRLVVLGAGILMALAMYFAGNFAYKESTLRAIEAKFGERPAVSQSYTTYVVHDGILTGPFPDREAWAYRDKVLKSIDPKTGEKYATPLSRGDSPLKVILENRDRYIRNYFTGLYEVPKRLIQRSNFNILGFWPLILGVFLLCAQNRRMELIVLGSWIAVYVFVLPAFSVQNRQVWPASFGLLFPGAYLFAHMGRVVLTAQPARDVLKFWVGSAILVLLVGTAALDADRLRKTRNVDYQAQVAARVGESGLAAPRFLFYKNTLTLYNRNVRTISLQRSDDAELQKQYFLRTKPDFVCMVETIGNLASAQDVIRRMLMSGDPEIGYWKEERFAQNAQLWSRDSSPERFAASEKVLFRLSSDYGSISTRNIASLTIDEEKVSLTAENSDPGFSTWLTGVGDGLQIVFEVHMTSPQDGTFEIFFRGEDEEPDDGRNVMRSIVRGQNKFYVEIPATSDTVQVRIDPMDFKGKVQFHSLEARLVEPSSGTSAP